jgi:hypothetical protein
MPKIYSLLKDLNFKVCPSLHRAFKITAALRGIKMKELLDAAFRCWLIMYGDEALKRALPKEYGNLI